MSTPKSTSTATARLSFKVIGPDGKVKRTGTSESNIELTREEAKKIETQTKSE